MKDGMDSTAVGRAPEPEREFFSKRKLIRPTLNHRAELRGSEPPMERRERPERVGAAAKKAAPPDDASRRTSIIRNRCRLKRLWW